MLSVGEFYITHQRPMVGLYGCINNVSMGVDIGGAIAHDAYVVDFNVGLIGWKCKFRRSTCKVEILGK